jgi:hypothetical protein
MKYWMFAAPSDEGVLLIHQKKSAGIEEMIDFVCSNNNEI